jgi:dnd system-associated protein 4
MRDIRRPDATEHIVERLITQKFSDTGVPVFPTIMELLIFAAGIGMTVGRRVEVPASGKGIPIRIFENNQKDGFVYLVALADAKKPNALAPENDDEIARAFEEFAAAGLEEIGVWLSDNPTDISAVGTLTSKIQTHLAATTPPIADPSPL